jgi:hypothetical protein
LDALDGERIHDGIGIGRVKSLDGVGDGVHARRDGHTRRQRHGQVDVVDNDLGQDLERLLRGLDPILGLADDRGALGSGVRRRDDNLRKIRTEGDGFAEAGRAATADGDHAISVDALGVGDGVFRYVFRGVHSGLSGC